MRLWRISNHADLSGEGGMRASGRWHTRGRRIVYLADHPASALLEMLIRMDLDLVPASYTLLRISIPDIIDTQDVDLADLPADWRQQPATTRRLGDEWLDKNDAPLLQVPLRHRPGCMEYAAESCSHERRLCEHRSRD